MSDGYRTITIDKFKLYLKLLVQTTDTKVKIEGNVFCRLSKAFNAEQELLYNTYFQISIRKGGKEQYFRNLYSKIF